MRFLKYTLPLLLTGLLVLLVHQNAIELYIPLLAVLSLSNRILGEFSELELQAELIFFHRNARMKVFKTGSAALFGVFNIWAFYFVSLDQMTSFQLLIFVIACGIVNCSFLLSLAHDLLHETNPVYRGFGQVLLFFVGLSFFGNEHIYGHHRTVCTEADKTSAKLGQSFYSYLWSAYLYRIKESFLYNPNYPSELRGKIQRQNISLTLINVVLLVLVLVFIANPWLVLAWYLAQAALTYVMFEVSNYIQHYGLSRKEIAGGAELEPFAIHHAWDYYSKYTNYITYLVSLHSYHHIDHLQAQKEGVKIDLDTKLPYCYYKMMLSAFIPPLWFRIMNKRCVAAEGLAQEKGRTKSVVAKKWAISASLIVLSLGVAAQSNIGFKYFGFTIHPRGDEQAHLMPYRLDKKGVFVPNVGGILSFQKNVFQDIVSVKFAQGFYTDSGGLPSGHTHIGFRLVFFQKKKHTLLFGFGPTWIYRRNWNVKEGYVSTGIFEDRGKIQYKYVWYGGEIEYDYQINDKLDFSMNFLPGYPLVLSFGFGVRYWLNI